MPGDIREAISHNSDSEKTPVVTTPLPRLLLNIAKLSDGEKNGRGDINFSQMFIVTWTCSSSTFSEDTLKVYLSFYLFTFYFIFIVLLE